MISIKIIDLFPISLFWFLVMHLLWLINIFIRSFDHVNMDRNLSNTYLGSCSISCRCKGGFIDDKTMLHESSCLIRYNLAHDVFVELRKDMKDLVHVKWQNDAPRPSQWKEMNLILQLQIVEHTCYIT